MDWRESVVSRLVSLFTCTIHLAKRVDEWVQPSNSSIPGTDSAISTSMASSFETHRFAMLLWMRSQTLMVRSALSRVSNHEAPGVAAMIRVNRKTL